MRRGRAFFCLLTIALLLLPQHALGRLRGCSMCGTACRCAGHGTKAPCSVRSVGCGAGGGAAVDANAPPRAVLADAPDCAPPVVADRGFDRESVLPSGPARPPLDRPPRPSC